VIPAIDLRGGKCVRLMRGDYAQETVFSDDPVAIAMRWAAAGATTLHVVDLDGAASGAPAHLQIVAAIRRVTAVTIHYGGGIRDDATIERVLGSGVDRVVLGTALISRPEWVAELCARIPEQIVLGIDAREGRVATDGWKQTSALTTAAAVRRANEIGVRRALFTDISQDGTLAGPNLAALRAVIAEAQFQVIASGGVARLEDLDAIAATGAAAAILGRALYTGAIDLREAIARTAGIGEGGTNGIRPHPGSELAELPPLPAGEGTVAIVPPSGRAADAGREADARIASPSGRGRPSAARTGEGAPANTASATTAGEGATTNAARPGEGVRINSGDAVDRGDASC
jgi:phosphoribosylformimino-5-aminoimidazole carboxamide ribotide isomerase